MSVDKKTIVVAMSGGVDSSVVAAMMHNAGHKVIGITLQLFDYGMALQKKGACCAGQDIYDAKMVADKLGFPHYILNYENKFREEVIDDFVDSYVRGETPLPCVRCNQSVKFNDLLKAAKELKADALATGHYVQKIINNGVSEMHKGVSEDKDQSYFLFSTTQKQLDYLMFPLGGQNKDETRDLARQLGLEVADKPDSQDICFVPNGNYRDVINKVRPEASAVGRFVHMDGFDLGEHKGIINYTVGQRRGLGIAFGDPIYVIKIDPKTNTVYVGPESALVKTQFLLKEVNWLAEDIKPNGLEVTAKIRSTTPGVRAILTVEANEQICVTLLEAEKAVTPGQACVFYEGSRVLGGGWITRDIK
ncbi:MAG: tRNA 2-thiouridine(34) synthase MnmA [Rickettsiaceae bacterium]|nr:tRNA 2-thiouridine(34) synthase MnmA [Rickettsiaceae bacterium]MDP5020826.1 tRNA 2-thiouridine(34) synthase MnmA [Rickettsiaceae bacterium]MDP5083356.1 tRNA 2-thiouridine(34) synthase MnmA [Rickettsiaceae bacterium]